MKNDIYINEIRFLYNKIKNKVKNKLILFREDENGGFVILRGEPFHGIEYYVDEGTIQLLKLMKNDIDFNYIINYIKQNNLYNYIKNIELRLKLFTENNIQTLKNEGFKIGLWSPTWSKYPHMLAWELTWRCNLRCTYCYANAGYLPNNYRELTTDEIKMIIDKISGRILSVWLGGGEPTLRSDLLDILEYLKKKDFFIMLSTNGVNLYHKTRIIKRVAELVDEIHIPLDGSNKTIHNKLRGEFNKIVWVIKEFCKLNANISTGTVVTKINANDIGNIIDFVANLGVKAWVWTPMFPCGRGLVNRYLMLTKHDLIKIYKLIKEKEKEYKGKLLIMSYAPGVTPLRMDYKTLRCGALNYYLLLAPNGDVYPCPYFRWTKFKLGNLIKDNIEDIMNDKNIIVRFLRSDDISEIKDISKKLNISVGNGKCINCMLYDKGYCNTGCKAMKIAMGIGLFDPFPYCTLGVQDSPLYQQLNAIRTES